MVYTISRPTWPDALFRSNWAKMTPLEDDMYRFAYVVALIMSIALWSPSIAHSADTQVLAPFRSGDEFDAHWEKSDDQWYVDDDRYSDPDRFYKNAVLIGIPFDDRATVTYREPLRFDVNNRLTLVAAVDDDATSWDVSLGDQITLRIFTDHGVMTAACIEGVPGGNEPHCLEVDVNALDMHEYTLIVAPDEAGGYITTLLIDGERLLAKPSDVSPLETDDKLVIGVQQYNSAILIDRVTFVTSPE